MNRSSLFSFEESPVWDPKIIRKFVVVPQDQLIKLNSIPGWTKQVQDEHNTTLQLDRDFPIENSQTICSVSVTQSNEIIEKNTQLFNEQTENCKNILKAYKVYEKKLTRSLSLFDLNKSCGTILDNKTVKRTLSLQNLCHSSNISSITSNFTEFISKNSSNCSSENILSKPFENITLSNQCKTSVSEPKESKILLVNEIDSNTMEIVLQSATNIPAIAENVNSHFKAAKEVNGILPAENVGVVSNNISDKHVTAVFVDKADLSFETLKESDGMLLDENSSVVPNKIPDQFIKHATESVNVDNSKLLLEITKENYEMSTENAATAVPSKSDQFIKYAIESVNVDKNNPELLSKNTTENNNCISSILEGNIVTCAKVFNDSAKPDIIESKSVNNANKLSLNKFTDSDNSVVIESDKLNISIEKEFSAHVISVSNNENITLSSSTQGQSLLSNSDCSPNAKIMHDKLSSNLQENTKPLMSTVDKHFISDSNSVEVVSSALTSGRKSIDLKSHEEICPNKSTSLDISAEQQLPLSKKTIVSETKDLVKNCSSDIKAKDELDDAKCDPTMFSPNNDAPFSKKRKLESRNKRSKRVKSEEKQGNIKIRSIKKVGEICYSAEEVKTMLDIMKQFL